MTDFREIVEPRLDYPDDIAISDRESNFMIARWFEFLIFYFYLYVRLLVEIKENIYVNFSNSSLSTRLTDGRYLVCKFKDFYWLGNY